MQYDRSVLHRTSIFLLAALLGYCGSPSLVHGQEEGALYPMQQKTKWGFINALGEWEIEPQYPQVLSFQDGLAAARTAGQNKWGFLNREGEWEIPPNYGKKRAAYRNYGGKKFYSAPFDPFNGEYAPAMVDGSLALINKEGDTVKKFPEYSMLRPFHDGLAAFAKDEQKGYINKKWDVVIEPEYEEVGDFHAGLAYFQEDFGDDYGFIDKNGNIVIEQEFEEVGHFENGLAPARTGAFEPFGYIDTNGEWAIDPAYEEAEPFSEGLAFVKTEERAYYIDENGNPQITSPIEGFKICHGHTFDKGLAMVGLVEENKNCGRVIQVGSFGKAANSAYAYINKSGDIIYRQSFEDGRYLKRQQDSIRAAERKAEKRREKAEAREERKQLAKCADFKSFGDTTAASYVEIGYKGVNRRFYYGNDVFERKESDTFRYHVPPLQRKSGHTFLQIQPITVEPSFMDPDELEAQNLGYRFSLSSGAFQQNENDCIKFPTDATRDGSVMNVKTERQSSLWTQGQIKYTDPDNSESYVLINAHPNKYRTSSNSENGSSDKGGFILKDDGDRLFIDNNDKLIFKYYPNDQKLEISARVSEKAEGGGVSSYGSRSVIQNFDGSTGKYVNRVVDRFDDHYVEYHHVVSYSQENVYVKTYRKDFTKEGVTPPDGEVTQDDLSFSDEHLVGEYKGAGYTTAVDLEPVVYDLSEN